MQIIKTARLIPGFFCWFGYDLPIFKRFKAIKKAGFTHVSIWLGKEEASVRNGKLEDFIDSAHNTGLEIECAHASYDGCNNIWIGNDSQKCELLAEYTEQIEYCGQSHIPILVMHVSQGNNAPGPNEGGLKFMLELLEVAIKLNVSIALENTRRTDGLNYLLENIKDPRLGMCYDSSHDFLFSKHPTCLLSEWGNRLLYTHFSDNDGHSDRHWLPGTGIIDWDLIKAAYPKDAKKCISLEVVPRNSDSESMSKFLENAYETGKWLIQKLSS